MTIRSSETTRETLLGKQIEISHNKKSFDQKTLFNFDAYIENGTPKHIPQPDQHFLQWFIGFFEAEGELKTWQDKKQRFEIIIDQKDPKLMYKIKKRLGFGNVTCYQKKSHTYWRYQIGSTRNLNRFILLLNGNLVTVKKNSQFQSWVKSINHNYQTNHVVFSKSVTVSLHTAWLSGFLEGDGGFYVSSNNAVFLSKNGSWKYTIRMKFYIIQKNELELLNHIKTLLKISTKIYQMKNGHELVKYNRLETACLTCHQDVIRYLNKYPFLGQRNILVHRWSRLIGYRTKKYPITEKSILKVKKLIQSTKNNS